ncbi:MAG TPA: hypothetical protein VFR31_14885 [Thermoanaerobaculia bacterium]|nr:hypothetical protein [Thermoanaerobaculia bacterium]
MTTKTIAGAVLAVLFMASSVRAQEECQRLGSHFQVTTLSESSGPESFRSFLQAMAASAKKAGDAGRASRIEALEPGKTVPSESSSLASCLLRRYLVARYGDRIVADLQEMVHFKTYAEEGRANWDAPEFLKQR